MPTFRIHYNAVKQTFYIPGVTTVGNREMLVRKRVKEPVNQGRGRLSGRALVLGGTCLGWGFVGATFVQTPGMGLVSFSRLVSGIQEKYLGNTWSSCTPDVD